MGPILTLLATAILRGLIAKGFGLELEAWLAAFTHLPHFACAILGVVLAVLVVEALGLAVEALIDRLRHRK